MKRYLDPRLILFVVLAALASVISAHGAWVFFGYLVDRALAVVFTAVLALGIIGLDAAATLEAHRSKRIAYISGMVLFLTMEVLANYFAGQASFVARVQAALALAAPQSDLLAITRSHPMLTRALVVLFLSLASIAVAAFVFAAANRVAQIRTGQADPLRTQLARLRRLSAQRRTWVRTLAHEVRKLRADVRSAHEQVRTTSAALADQVRNEQEESARLSALLAQKSAEAKRLSADLEGLSATGALDVRSIAQLLRDRGVSLRTIGEALGVNEKTVRNWTVDVRSNGHLVEKEV